MNGLIAGAALFVLLALTEAVHPAYAAARTRWVTNFAWGAAMMGATRLASALAPFAAAVWAAREGVGLFNWISLPPTLTVIVTVIALDCAVYWQHRAFHRFGWLWRWHKTHHDDRAFDVTTGLRFHPIEGVMSLVWKSGVTVALGVPPFAVPIFEFWLMAGSLVEHSNIGLPAFADRVLRHFWVTPAMHRIHHSAHTDDAQHNFGFAIAVWDHLFGSYRAVPTGDSIGPPQQA